jgi:hypothetical protein
MGVTCNTNRAKRKACKILVGKPERPRRSWVYNIKIDLREIGWVVWTGLIWLKIETIGGPW